MRIYNKALIILLTLSASVFAVSFQRIGMPSGGIPYFEEISANYILVGRNPNWVWSGGAYTVPGFPGLITALSDDGVIIVSGEFGHGNLFYKTIGGITEIIPGISGVSYTTPTGISADGSKIVGTTRGGGYQQTPRWVYEDGSYTLLPLPSGAIGTHDLHISSDGSIIAGTVWGGTATGHIVRWENGSINVLPNPEGKFFTACEISGDGSTVIAGHYRWQDGTINILPIPTDVTSWAALAVSFDGSLVFGNGGGKAFVWDEINGTRLLKDFLEDDYGLNLTGWDLQNVSATDASGNIITGYGINPQGQGELWIATIPEPATIALLALGGLMLRKKAGRI